MIRYCFRLPLLVGVCLTVSSGCSQMNAPTADNAGLKERATEALKLGIRYKHLPTVRAYAIEALRAVGKEQHRPWIRQAVHDDHPAVRFAACIALGELKDRLARDAIRSLLRAPTVSDRIAAIFYIHRMGDPSKTHKLASYLLDDPNPANRRHAAFVLGRMGETGAIKLLARSMRDDDAGVRANALESMALLGSPEAVSTLVADAFGGAGAQQTLAIMSLALLNDRQHRALFKDKLTHAEHIESRLAAARALGQLRDRSGFDIALGALDYQESSDAKNESPENRRRRVREMAALALGAIGDRRALPKLGDLLDHADDPRLQIAAAKAILEIR